MCASAASGAHVRAKIIVKEYPLTQGFDLDQPAIGKVVFTDDVSVSFDHIISLGGIIKKSHKEGDATIIDEFEILHFALIPDSQFVTAKDVINDAKHRARSA